MRKTFLMLTAVLMSLLSWADLSAATYVKTDLAQIKSTDNVLITWEKEGSCYAATNDQGTSKAPAAVEVTLSGTTATTTATNVQWNVAAVTDGYQFFPAGDSLTWLYCTNSNNGVRVGTNTASVFSVDETSGYLKHNGTSRFIGVYNSQDVRCYTSVNSNITGQTLAFYVESASQGGDTGEGTTLYFKPDAGYWAQADAKFAAYVDGAFTDFLTLATGESDIYTLTVSASAKQIFFLRYAPATTTISWDKAGDTSAGLWNQTAALTVPADGTDLYTITGWNGGYDDLGNSLSAGSWSVYDATPVVSDNVVLDFTNAADDWGMNSTADKTEKTYSNGTYSITFGVSDTGHKTNKGYIMFGKANATLVLPKFDFAVDSIVVTGNSGASAATVMNVYVGDEAVSTATTGSQGVNTYAIAAAYKAAGNQYTLKVTSNHNAQVTKIEVYKSPASGGDDPVVTVPDLYIIGDIEGIEVWNTNSGLKLAYDAQNKVYTGSYKLTSGYFALSTKLVPTATDGSNWTEFNNYRFAPAAEGSLVVGQTNKMVAFKDKGDNVESFFVATGKYAFEVSLEEMTLKLSADQPVVTPDTWTVAGSFNEWNTENTDYDLTQDSDNANIYAITVSALALNAGDQPAFKIVKNHTWAEAYPSDNYVVTGVARDGIYDLTIIFDANTKTISIDLAYKDELPVSTGKVYVKKALSEIKSTDNVLLVYGSYAVANNNGTSAAPATVEVTIKNNQIVTESTNVQWNVAAVTGGYQFFPAGDTLTWLYCTNTNNGVRVGTGENNVFEMTTNEYYLFNTGTSRYVGMYNNQDIRCYTTVNSNIKNDTLAFYVELTQNDDSVVVSTDTWTIAGQKELTGYEWNQEADANDMSLVQGYYELTLKNVNLAAGRYEFKVVKNHAWDESYPANNDTLVITRDGQWDIIFLFDPDSKEILTDTVYAGAYIAPVPTSGYALLTAAATMAMQLNPASTTEEYMLLNVELKKDDVLTIYDYTAKDAATIVLKEGLDLTGMMTLAGNRLTVLADGIYDFYYAPAAGLWVNKKAAPDLYIIGAVEGIEEWNTNSGLKLAYDETTQLYTGEYKLTSGYFALSTKLVPTATDGSNWTEFNNYRFAPAAEGSLVVGQTNKMVAFKDKGDNVESFFVATGKYAFEVSLENMTILLTADTTGNGGDTTVVENHTLYIVGSVDSISWSPSIGLPLSYDDSTKLYTGRYTLADGYFALATQLSSSWAALNQYRLSPKVAELMEANTTYPIVPFWADATTGDVAFHYMPGTYDIVVSLEDMTIQLIGEDVPVVPSTYYVIGSIAELGNWTPAVAPQMRTVSDSALVYVVDSLMLTEGETIEYKILEKKDTLVVDWLTNAEWSEDNKDRNMRVVAESNGQYRLDFYFTAGIVSSISARLTKIGDYVGPVPTTGYALLTADTALVMQLNTAATAEEYMLLGVELKKGDVLLAIYDFEETDELGFKFKEGLDLTGMMKFEENGGDLTVLADGIYDFYYTPGAGSAAGLWISKQAEPIVTDLYLIGEIEGATWTTNAGIKLNYNDSTDLFTGKYTVTGNGYFALVSKLMEGEQDWEGITAYRYAPVSDQLMTANTPAALVKLNAGTESFYSFHIKPGVYTFEVSITNKTITLKGEDVPVEPTTYHVIGDVPELANWATDEAPQMTMNGDTAFYTVKSIMLAKDAVVAYKIIAKQGDFVAEWLTSATTDPQGDNNMKIVAERAGEYSVMFSYIVGDVNTISAQLTWIGEYVKPVPTTGYALYIGNDENEMMLNNLATSVEYMLQNVSLSKGDVVNLYDYAKKQYVPFTLNEQLDLTGMMTLTATGSLEVLADGTYDFYYASASGLWISKQTAPVAPDLYMVGDMPEYGWLTYKGLLLAYNDSTDLYTAEVDLAGANEGYFAFVTKLVDDAADGSNWEEFANYRYAPVSAEAMVDGQAMNMIEFAKRPENTESFHIANGKYLVEVSLTNMTVKLTALQTPAEPATYHVIGSIAELAVWEPSEAPEMAVLNGDTLVYTVKSVMLQKDSIVEYKILKKTANNVEWLTNDSLGSNMTLVAERDGEYMITFAYIIGENAFSANLTRIGEYEAPVVVVPESKMLFYWQVPNGVTAPAYDEKWQATGGTMTFVRKNEEVTKTFGTQSISSYTDLTPEDMKGLGNKSLKTGSGDLAIKITLNDGETFKKGDVLYITGYATEAWVASIDGTNFSVADGNYVAKVANKGTDQSNLGYSSAVLTADAETIYLVRTNSGNGTIAAIKLMREVPATGYALRVNDEFFPMSLNENNLTALEYMLTDVALSTDDKVQIYDYATQKSFTPDLNEYSSFVTLRPDGTIKPVKEGTYDFYYTPGGTLYVTKQAAESQYYIYGSGVLGDWKMQEANLMTVDGTTATLAIEGITVDEPTTLEYKVVRYNEEETDLQWIPDGDNRTVKLGVAGEYNLTFTYMVGDTAVSCKAELIKAAAYTIADFLKEQPTTAKTITQAVVTYAVASSNNYFITDASGKAIVIYDNKAAVFGEVGATLKPGDVIEGIAGTYALYNSQPEIVLTAYETVKTDGEAPAPVQLAAACTTDDANQYVTYKAVEVTKNGNNYYIFGDVQIYDKFKLGYTLTEGCYDLTGIAIPYKQIMEFCPTEAPVEKLFNITLNPVTNGTLSVDKYTAGYGATVTVTATPDPSYDLDTIHVLTPDGMPVPVIGNTFTMPKSDVTVSAVFSYNPAPRYAVVTMTNAYGTVTADKTEATEGSLITLTAEPAEGYILASWNVTGLDQKPIKVTDNQFVMPAQGVNAAAVFRAYTIKDFLTEMPKEKVTIGSKVRVAAAATDATYGHNYVYVIDDTDTPLCIFDRSVSGTTTLGGIIASLANGVELKGLSGTFTQYQNLPEFIPAAVPEVVAATGKVEPQVLTALPDTIADNSRYITLRDRALTQDGSNYYIDGIRVNTVRFGLTASLMAAEYESFTGIFCDEASSVLYLTEVPVQKQYAISVTADAAQGSALAPATAAEGADVVVNVTPATGYELASITVTCNGKTVEVDAQNAFTMPRGDVNIAVAFRLKKFNVTFVDQMGNLIGDIQQVEYGKAATAPVPTDKTAQGLRFKEWQGDYTNITADTRIIAVYEIIICNVTIVVREKEVTLPLPYGTSVADLMKQAQLDIQPGQQIETADSVYTFTGWSPVMPETITADGKYVAQYTQEVRTYKVVFVYEDNTEIWSDNVAYGSVPVYNGTTPVKAEDDQYTYTFSGWSPELTAVTGEQTYTAQFTATQKTPTGLDALIQSGQAVKIVENGKVYILVGDKRYTITGAAVR